MDYMKNTQLNHQRVNITLPEATLKIIDRVAGTGKRSRFIDTSVKYYVRETTRSKIRESLKNGYATLAEADRLIAKDWSVFDRETWPND